jgi:twitching motility protein PilU
MEREQAVRLTQNLLRKMVERNGSDLFITRGFPPAIKVDGTIHKATDTPLSARRNDPQSNRYPAFC